MEKGYTQITLVSLFLVMVVICHWLFHQLDTKNAFLHGELQEMVYMDQPQYLLLLLALILFVISLLTLLYGLKQSPCA